MASHFNDNKVHSETILTYFDGNEFKHFSGKISGTIPTKPQGEKGWGWDPIFIPEGSQQTYGERERAEVINFRSHKIALEKFRDYLN